MNSTRQAEITSMISVQSFLKANPLLKKNNKELTIESDSMDANLKLALAAGNVKGRIETISTDDVFVAKKNMSYAVMNLLRRGIVKCRQEPTNESLGLKLKRRSDYISRAAKITAVEHATEMLAILSTKDNLDYLTNIKQKDIDAAAVLVNIYDSIKEVPTITIKTKMDTGSKIVDQATHAGRKNVANIITLVKIDCENSAPEMVSGILHASSMTILGVRFTPIKIVVLDAATGDYITGAKSMEQLKKKVRVLYSDKEGFITIKSHKAGVTLFTITMLGYEDYLLKATIKKKALNEFEVRMMRNN
jgi:hypothetical protein